MTTITFLGLLILTNLTSSGAEIIMGVVPGVTPTHDQIIAYLPGDFVSQTNWPKAGMVVINKTAYDYVRIDRDNITFSGPTDAFVNGIHNAIHLSCCCPTMKGLRPEYGDKDQTTDTKAAAHVLIANGQLGGYTFTTGALGFQLIFTEDKPLTISGTLGTTSRQLVLKSGANVIIANSPLAALSGFGIPHSTDFVSYYNMGITSATCTLKPGDAAPGPCAQSSAPCVVPAAMTVAHAATLTAAQKALAEKAKVRLHGIEEVVDINCSGSAWP